MGSKLKVALVVKRYLIDLTMENVVVNRAGRFKVFNEMDPALKCLGVSCRVFMLEYLSFAQNE